MAYQFELDRRSLYQVIGGGVVVLILVFVAGMVVGLRLQLPDGMEGNVSGAPDTIQAGTMPLPDPSPRSDSTMPVVRNGGSGTTHTETSESESGPNGGDGTSSERRGRSSTAGGTSSEALNAPYTVQVGFFRDPANARNRAEQLRRAGHTVRVERDRRRDGTYYRVWVGAYDRFAAAARHLDSLRRYASGAYVARTDAGRSAQESN